MSKLFSFRKKNKGNEIKLVEEIEWREHVEHDLLSLQDSTYESDEVTSDDNSHIDKNDPKKTELQKLPSIQELLRKRLEKLKEKDNTMEIDEDTEFALDNVIFSKMAHIFHGVKILLPKNEEYFNEHNTDKEETKQDRKKKRMPIIVLHISLENLLKNEKREDTGNLKESSYHNRRRSSEYSKRSSITSKGSRHRSSHRSSSMNKYSTKGEDNMTYRKSHRRSSKDSTIQKSKSSLEEDHCYKSSSGELDPSTFVKPLRSLNEETYQTYANLNSLNTYYNSLNLNKKPFTLQFSNDTENILNNVYSNFLLYENKIKQMERKKKEIEIIADSDEILFIDNFLQTNVFINESNRLSLFYKLIRDSINHLNELHVRNAFRSLKDVFLKYRYNSQDLKKVIQNVFVSEILYRYKIIKKIEAIFNLGSLGTEEDFLEYSVVIKRIWKNISFDYLIDLRDVNGRLSLQEYMNILQGQNEKHSLNYVLSNMYTLPDDKDEKSYSTKEEEMNLSTPLNTDTLGNIEFEAVGDETKKKNKYRREKKTKYRKNSIYTNPKIDFSNFQVAYEEEYHSVYYYITRNEIHLNEIGKTVEDETVKGSKKEIEKKKTVIDKFISNKILHKGRRKLKKEKENEIHQELNETGQKKMNQKYHKKTTDEMFESIIKKGSLNTTIFYYIDLKIPANFTYVIALLIEIELYKSWIPYYNFPFNFGISECKIMSERGLFDRIVYTKITMPWMIHDRYLILDLWICEDFEHSKGIFLYASNFQKQTGYMKRMMYNNENSIQLEMTIHGFICPTEENKTIVKCFAEISPNAHLNTTFLSFLTKVFVKTCISHFIKACTEFNMNSKYMEQFNKNKYIYDRLRNGITKYKIY